MNDMVKINTDGASKNICKLVVVESFGMEREIGWVASPSIWEIARRSWQNYEES